MLPFLILACKFYLKHYANILPQRLGHPVNESPNSGSSFEQNENGLFVLKASRARLWLT